MRQIFDGKYQGETVVLTFDFTSALAASETISSATVSAVTYSGTDASPSTIINGAAVISGQTVKQSVTGGVEGVMYNLTCSVETSAGQVVQIQGYLAVVPATL